MAKPNTPAPTTREKMNTLLKEMGGTPELITQFDQLLESWMTSQKTVMETKYKQKLDTAKQMCLEDTNQFKIGLARKVQLFFEAKSDKIESTMAKQVAVKESAAEADLKKVKALLEGVQINSLGEADLQGLKNENGQLKKKVAALTEERNTAVTKVNRANGIASKALERNRILESASKAGTTVTESVATPAKAPAASAPGKGAATPTTPARRSSATPSTTNVVTEGVQNGKPPAQATPAQQPTGTMTGWDPKNVAANMED
jgi:hypothetical protein